MWPKVSVSLIKIIFVYTGHNSCKLELLKDGKILIFKSNLMSCDKSCSCIIEFIKPSLAFYPISPTRLINSIKREHSCYILLVYKHLLYHWSVCIFANNKSYFKWHLKNKRARVLYEIQMVISDTTAVADRYILYKYNIPCAGDSRKYHPEECDYQPRRSRG